MEFLEEELRNLGEASFAREHLCVWDPPPQEGESDIDMESWVRLGTADTSERPSPVAFGIEVSPDRKWTTIGMAGAVADGRYVGVVKSGRGSAWVPDAVKDLAKQWSPQAIAINPSGPAGSLLADLTAAKIDVTAVSGRDLGQATGMVLDGVTEGTIRHSSQKLLNISVGAARTRMKGDAKVWDPRGSTDIAPLQAVSIALWALGNAKPRRQHSGLVQGIS